MRSIWGRGKKKTSIEVRRAKSEGDVLGRTSYSPFHQLGSLRSAVGSQRAEIEFGAF